ncbi:hypothetical protein Ancab_014693 [Ancistrocladus abbreviatus]
MSGCSVGAGRRSQSAAVDLVMPLGGACWTSPISLIGAVGPIGAPDNMGLELVINKKGGSDGPGVRPETMISSSTVQRDEAEEVKSIPGAPHLQLDRGRRKCKKKSLSDDILQLRLSKRVIGKGTVHRRVGRIRSGMEDTTDPGGQISSGESICDSQFINCNKVILAQSPSPPCSESTLLHRQICDFLMNLGIVNESNEQDMLRQIVEMEEWDAAKFAAEVQKRGMKEVQFLFFDASCVGPRVLF